MNFTSNGGSIVGVGVDIVDHVRFGALLARRPVIMERIFSPAELRYAKKYVGEALVGRLAARFAAKEAVSKAMGIDLFSLGFLRIEILNATSGRPQVFLRDSALIKAKARGIGSVMVSLSHEKKTSIAFAVALSND